METQSTVWPLRRPILFLSLLQEPSDLMAERSGRIEKTHVRLDPQSDSGHLYPNGTRYYNRYDIYLR